MKPSIINELKENNVFLSDLGNYYDSFDDILEYALLMQPHEKRFFGFGVIFTDGIIPIEHEKQNGFNYDFTDGKNVFGLVIYKRIKKSTIFIKKEYLSDFDLLLLCTTKKTCIIKRYDNTLKIYYHECIYINENRIWRKIDQREMINNRLSRHYKGIKNDLFQLLLDMAYYELAINKIGSTIVYWLDENVGHEVKVKEKLCIDVNKNIGKSIMKNYIEKNDGAVIVNNKGILVAGKVHLQYTEESEIVICKKTGTRHTSAQRFSYEHPRAIIITVSEDGPVSIFSDGANITKLNDFSETANNTIDSFATKVGKYSDSGEFTTRCPICKKYFLITWSEVSGYNDPEKELCPVCNTILYERKCFQIDAYLKKKI